MIRKRTWDRLGMKNGPGMRRSSIVSEEEPSSNIPPQPISRLFHCIIDFWSLLLLQESWWLSFNSGTLTCENPSNCSASDSHMISAAKSPIEVDLTTKNGKNANGITKARLCEERDRLSLWKSSFTDEDLDGLLSSTTSLHQELGYSILKALLIIADTLCASVELSSMDQSFSPETDAPTFRETAQSLQQLINDGMDIINGSYAVDNTGADITTPTMMSGVNASDESYSLFGRLQREISRLLRFSFQIGLVASGAHPS
ncbi:hypothetical protein F5Y10DRAFT_292995 [Nemania abortiva]|nr:hypothetical protein F5Y10DRAFT_292995 [Nemania abortiva]